MKLFISFLIAATIAAVSSLHFTEIPLQDTGKNVAPLHPGEPTPMNADMQAVLTHQVRLVNSLGGVCGGTLVSSTRVVTAAHCLTGFNYDKIPTILQVYNSDYVDVYAGVTGFGNLNEAVTRRVPKSNVKIGSWIPVSNYNNDLAVLTLPEPIEEIPGKISYMSLPTAEICQSNLVGKQVTVTGWSSENNVEQMTLRVNQVPLLADQVCTEEYTRHHDRQRYGQWEHYTTCDYMENTMTCAAGNSDGSTICRGDDGGPLAYTADNKQYLIGVSSFGSKTCGVGAPGAFSDVCAHLNLVN